MERLNAMNRELTATKQADKLFDPASSYQDSPRLSPVISNSTNILNSVNNNSNRNRNETSTSVPSTLIKNTNEEHPIMQTPTKNASPSSYELTSNRSHDGVFLRPGAVAPRFVE